MDRNSVSLYTLANLENTKSMREDDSQLLSPSSVKLNALRNTKELDLDGVQRPDEGGVSIDRTLSSSKQDVSNRLRASRAADLEGVRKAVAPVLSGEEGEGEEAFCFLVFSLRCRFSGGLISLDRKVFAV